MKTIEVMAENTSLGDLVELAQREAGVMLTKSGQPVAQVIPMSTTSKPRIAPLHPGAWDVSADFDDPLPEEFWLGKE